jgi:pimeloyl-ACP methyl ester carboxylesterase
VRIADATLAAWHRPGRGPVVVFEAGLGLPGALWRPVGDRLPADRALLYYDRAGLGRSGPGTAPRSGTRLLGELRELLGALRLAPPYVLVGHSAGGFVVRLFALAYPAEVAGIVLVDPSHEDEEAAPLGAPLRLAAAVAGTPVVAAARRAARRLPLLRRATRGGRADLLRAAISPRHLRGAAEEDRAYPATVAELRRAAAGRSMPAVPLRVITAERWVRGRRRARYRALHGALAASSPRGAHLLAPRSGHLVMREDPGLVAAAVEAVSPGGTR